MNKFENGYIEKLERKKIDEKTIKTLVEIERDTWAFFMGEYVKCTNCGNVNLKEDIYGELGKKYRQKTIGELEIEYGRRNINCTCCGSETEDVRGEELIGILESRIFSTIDSFVNVYKSMSHEIIGFSYGFVDTPIGTYDKEFSYHFTKKLYEKFISKFGNENIINLSGVCIIEKEINLNIVIELIRRFVYSVDLKYDKLTGIGEAIKGTPTYKLYSEIGFRKLELENNDFFKDKDKIPNGAEVIFLKKSIKKSKAFFNDKLNFIIKNNK